MREKTSITLSPEVLRKLDDVVGKNGSRSAVIESVLRAFFKERERRKLHARELERINAAADRLNREAEDVLAYQAPEQ